jgi:hypothetical protein
MPFGAGFTPKDWVNEPAPGVPSSTPINATALEDLEQRLWDATEDEVAAAMEEAASVEDLMVTASDVGGFSVDTATCMIPIMFPCKIAAGAVVVQGTIAASNTAYWTLSIRRARAGVFATIVSRTTRLDTGLAMADRVPWTFDTSTWDEGTRICEKDDAIYLAWFKTAGSPTNPPKMTFAARIEPV